MRKQLNILIISFLLSYSCYGQPTCDASTVTPAYYFYPGSPYNFITASGGSVNDILYLCTNAVVYDTALSNLPGNREVMIESGASYTWKRCGAFESIVWVKNGGTLNLLQGTCATVTTLFYESGAIINDPFNTLGPTTPCSSIVFPSVNCSTGIIQQTKDKLVNLSPNPSSGSLKLKVDFEIDDGLITIHTILGKAIYLQNISAGINEIKLTGLANGLYYFTILEKDKIVSNGKLVIE